MQLIEHSELGIRSAVMTLEKRGSPVRFVLLPMVHVGSPAFYEEVQRRLEACDVVVVEGLEGRRAKLLTLAYRIGGRLRRGGLVQQARALDLSALRGRIVRPDASAAEFAHGWKGVTWWMRWALYLLAPLFGVWMAVVGPERAFARHDMTLDDMPSRDELDAADDALDEAMIDARDRRLCEELVRLASAPTAQTVGVCWGAQHMRAVVVTLHLELRYRIVDATWVKVF